MNCTLCGLQINNYSSVFNHLEINETHSADICQECLGKIINWQQTNYTNLFPTKTAKKILENKKLKNDGGLLE
jgi:hypothetical protein